MLVKDPGLFFYAPATSRHLNVAKPLCKECVGALI
jgi:hypothetical protein